MPIPYFDFTKTPLQRRDNSPYQNLLSGTVGAYQQGKEFKNQQETQAQQKETRALSNKEQAMKNEIMKLYGKERERRELEALSAKTAHEKRLASGEGSGGVSNPILNALQARDVIEKKYGKNSPELSYIDSYLKKATSGALGGKNSAITGPVKTKNQNAMLANKQRLFLDKIVNHKYKGFGSNFTIAKDLVKYLFNSPEAEEDLINAGVASKVAPEFGAVQLGGQSVTPTVHALEKQEKAIKQGWPALLELFTNNFPSGLAEKVNERHSNILGESARLREESFNDMLNNNSVSDIGARNGFVRGIMNGEEYEIPIDKIKEFIQSGGSINE